MNESRSFCASVLYLRYLECLVFKTDVTIKYFLFLVVDLTDQQHHKKIT